MTTDIPLTTDVAMSTDMPMTTMDVTDDNSSSDATTQESSRTRFPLRAKVRNVLYSYFVPLLVLTGTIGNVLSFIIYSQPAFRHSMTSFLFRVLAVTDTLALNFGSWDNWLRFIRGGRSVFTETMLYCKFSVYLRYLLADIPVWVLVLVAFERVVGVTVPHRARLILTKFRLIIALVCIMVFLVGYNIPMFMSNSSKRVNGTGEYKCFIKNVHLTYRILPWMDLVIYSLLPLLLMVISSVIIIVTVVRRKRMLETVRSKSSDTNTLTVTLLAVCFVFMLLTLPHAFYSLLVDPLWASHKEIIDFRSWRTLAGFLRYVNNAINFFLYCLSGQPFRKELARLFCRCQPPVYQEYSSGSTRMSVVSKSSFSHSTN